MTTKTAARAMTYETTGNSDLSHAALRRAIRTDKEKPLTKLSSYELVSYLVRKHNLVTYSLAFAFGIILGVCI